MKDNLQQLREWREEREKELSLVDDSHVKRGSMIMLQALGKYLRSLSSQPAKKPMSVEGCKDKVAKKYKCSVYKVNFEDFQDALHSFYNEHLDEIVIQKIIDEAMYLYANQQPVIACLCKNEDKHGTTSIHCCNHCGLPTEDFWTKQNQPKQ